MNISSIINNSSLPIAPTRPGAAADATIAQPRQARDVQASDTSSLQTPQAASQTQQPQPSNKEQLEAAVKAVNDFLKPLNNSLQFNIDDDTGKIIVKVVDSTTNEVIKQFPSDEMLAIAKAIDNMKGLLIQQKA